ncbi:phosphoenolpyruvate--protein phosphotransferase [Aerococcus urinaeequi]|uniref:Phosphoenolpyruvate-protein phosphotransferase n=3 Tax=Aerococcus TaxID=1375 RepID=A0ABR5ZVZ0_9LACT|nr:MULTISPECIES: phosphoenolpyruvate--protein phosphotransferase [Lactobacillales]KAF3302530.1 phosphoenolpyruvate--protein phosphotransferase [Carnobacterium sp. PL17RED31]ALZ88174.1 phosphoenolpyruvate--protein phosphotransferase [Aerococcus urinaeequi]KAF3298910.1 phosphoenolpyruvate--protein phosphotransferase [Carnobacterium sp. PL26RED25]KAF3300895.1 phosphoenolpyruvate--protein phosphotransferase [Carnobacterium sp. PL12RED10]KAF3303993.1 phosphoenolpyruvate--protein phosphotransferase 
MTKLTGIAASDGIAIAKAFLVEEPDLSFEISKSNDSQQEKERLAKAIADSKVEIEKIKAVAAKSLSEEEAQVFDAHLMVLEDPELQQAYTQKIDDETLNAESAVRQTADFYIEIFKGMEDNPYMQERAADIKDVTDRLVAHLLGVKIPDLSTIDEEVVVVAYDLTPSDTAQLNRQFVKGFATDIGGRTSHSAIMSRSLEIAAVVGTGNVSKEINDGDTVIVDGLNGDVIVNPDDATIAEYEKIAADFLARKAEWEKLKDAETLTKDGKKFEIAANIGTPKDLEGVHSNGAEAIGLYRTEFLYMDSDEMPTEDEQFESYKVVLEGMNGHPVVVRTMDIGGDKHLPYLQLPEEMNPFLGYRAIRIGLNQPELLRVQLRALLRASVYGSLRIMFPMISNLPEFRAAKAIYEEEKAKLESEGVEVADDIQVGIMIEIPAAAVIADQFAKEVDFFSIGTNDLIQYTMAADRMNEHVSYLYQPFNPSVLRLIKNVIDASHKEGKWTGMCGEVAGEPMAAPLLVGMGLDEFSMSASSVLKIRSLISKLDSNEMAELANKVVTEATSSDEAEALIKAAVPELADL